MNAAARSRPLTLLLLPLALLVLALGVQGVRSLERAEAELHRAQRSLVAAEASSAAAAPLRAGIARIDGDRLLLLGALGASLLTLLATALLLRRQQQRLLGAELETLQGSLRALAEGQAPPPAVVAPEGSLRALLQESHVAVWQRTEQAREQLGQLQQIRDALDRTATNVLIADRDNRIIYVNRSLLQTMTAAEADLRTQLPRFAASRLLGGPVEMLLVDPERQGKILRDLTAPHHVLMEVGRRHFDVTVSPLRGEGGERMGFIAEWRERTAEARVEQELSTVVNAAVDGDFSRRIALEGKEGFQYQIGRSINRLLKTADLGFAEVERVLRALAHGDLTQAVTGEFKGTFAELGQLANATIGELRSIVAQIQDATEAINSAAREIVRGSSDLSDRTQQQSDRLQGTSSAVEQLTATVRQNAAHAGQANQLAIGASDIAQRGGAVVSEVVRTMNGIDAASRKIVDIISVIDGIAFQTNILALNAAVEAARAGEQGRGFAVVAAEVRNLAKRSAGAAREIKALIGDSVNEVASGARLVEQAGSTMAEIVDSVQRVTSIMAEITAASEAQSRGIEQVSRNIADMDGSTQQNAVLVEETTATAHLLEAQLHRLAASVARFELGGERRRRAGDHLEVEAPSPGPAEPAPRAAAPAAPAAPARPPSPAPARRPELTAAPARERPSPPQGHRNDDGWVEF